jgi:hypothetical protein
VGAFPDASEGTSFHAGNVRRKSDRSEPRRRVSDRVAPIGRSARWTSDWGRPGRLRTQVPESHYPAFSVLASYEAIQAFFRWIERLQSVTGVRRGFIVFAEGLPPGGNGSKFLRGWESSFLNPPPTRTGLRTERELPVPQPFALEPPSKTTGYVATQSGVKSEIGQMSKTVDNATDSPVLCCLIVMSIAITFAPMAMCMCTHRRGRLC